MNKDMWKNQAVIANFEKLKTYQNTLFIEPSEGLLACDQFGIGKMPPNDLLFLAIKFIFTLKNHTIIRDLINKSFLITGGATSEKIDAARKITNNSSGMMGLLIAQVIRFRGGKVTYIHGSLKINEDITDGIKSYQVVDSLELNNLIKNEIQKNDYLIMNAAVTDIKVKQNKLQKISKDKLEEHLLNNLEIVPDILKNISSLKKQNQKFIGFCAYTGGLKDLREIIKKKFEKKGCDLIFANPIDLNGQGFGEYAENEGWLFDNKGFEHYIEKTSKLDLANKLISRIISIDK
tara:strand:- start:21 stop:893 length:873 start_codon:yes stop_codon:yes gene_type:complete